MEYGKGILILSIVVCLLLGMASVCAADANDTAMTAVDAQDNLEINDDDYIVEVTDDINGSSDGPQEDISEPNLDSDKSKAGNDLLQSACGDEMDVLGEEQTGNYGDLQELIKRANAGDVITLDRNYAFTDVAQKDGIVIDKEGLTIDGNGYTIDACKKSRIFHVKATDVKLININFINAYRNSNGGAIYLKSASKSFSISIVNSSFVNNYAKKGGSAIWGNVQDASISVVNCSFVNNGVEITSKGKVIVATSGVVYLKGKLDSVSVVDCSFVNNSAKDGGAINLNVNSGSIVNCSFIDNSAKTKGGSIFLTNPGGSVSVVDCSFIDNSAKTGGAIYYKGTGKKPICSIKNCGFMSNSADSEGGAIYGANSKSSVTVGNCSFMNNSGVKSSGAVFWKSITADCSFVNCSFVNNFVTKTGSNCGAVSLNFAEGSIENCNFVNNSAKSHVGAIGLTLKKGHVVNCSFVNNSVAGEKGKFIAGAISLKFSKNGSIENCSFVNNSVNGYVAKNKYFGGKGGAVDLEGSEVSVNSCNFVNNYVTAPAGSIYKKGNPSLGGAIYSNAKKSSVVNCIFMNNFANGSIVKTGGGAIYLNKKGSVVENCIFADNYFSGNGKYSGGSAIYLYAKGSVSDCSFVSNMLKDILSSADYENSSLIFTIIGSGGENNHNDTIYSYKEFNFNGDNVGRYTEMIVGPTEIMDLNNISCTVKVYSGDNLVDNVSLVSDGYGRVTYDYSKLPDGYYWYNVYAGDMKRGHVSITGDFICDRFTISVSDITYGEYPVVNLTSDVSGNYSLIVDGKSYGVYELNESNNHHLSITVPVLLNAGNDYLAFVELIGTEFHNSTNDTTSFNVTRALPDFNVTSSENEYEYGQDVVCMIGLPDGATGNVIFHCLNEILDEMVNASLQNSLNLGKLNVGQYVLQVNYTGDNNYRNATKEIAFNVTPKDNVVVVNVASVSYPDEVTVSVGATADGVYTIDINGTEYNVTANAEGINLKLAAGNYYANIANVTMKNYNIISTNATFTVKKGVNNIVVSVGDVVLPNDAVVSVEADVDGVYTVVVNGSSVDVNVVKGSGNASIALPAGESYVASTAFADNENYTVSTTNAVFDVVKGINTINVTVGSVDYPDEVIVNVNADVGGVYAVDINGTEYDVTAGVAKSLKLAAGNYYASVVGYSSPYYEAVINNATFTVKKAVNNIMIGVDDVVLPDNATVCVEADVDGVYTVVVNGSSVDVNVVKGSGNASIALPAGESYIAGTTFVNENYTANITNAVFDVVKGINTINVTVGSVEYPNEVTVIINADVDGVYAVDINGVEYNVTSGVAKSIKLAAGDYYACVVGYSSPYYDAVINNASFTVKKAVNNIVVSVEDVVLPGNVTVCVEAGVDGVYTVVVNGTSVDVAVVKGRGNASIALPAGESYVASTTFVNENYTADITNAVFDVTKFVNNVFVSVEDVALPGNATICIKADVDGVYVVVFKFYDPLYVTVVNGVGNASIKLNSGPTYHTNTTLVNGDESYDSIVTEADFDVTKSRNSIYLTVDDVYYPNNVTLRVNADVDGNYTVDINGTRYTVANNGVVSVKLAPGSYSADIVDYFSAYYWPEITGGEFTVKKQINIVRVGADNVVLPNDAVVSVKADIDGIYAVVVNGVSINVTVVNGVGNASIALPAGDSYIASASFADIENYDVSITNAVFDVVKGINTVNVTVGSVEYPNEVIVNVNADVGGVYTVDINGVEYNVTSGVAKSIKLAAGDYYACVVGYSSPYYDAVINNASFTVEKAVNEIVVSVEKVVLPNDAVVSVKADIDGIYAVVVNGVSINVTVVNGVGNASIALPAGDLYHADITFDDRENYTVSINNAMFDVVKGINTVNLTAWDVSYPDDVFIYVDADVYGNYTVDINGTKFNVTSGGCLVINLPMGTYHATVVGYSSQYYDAVINGTTFTVGKPTNNIVINAISVVLPENVTIGVNADVDGNYTVVINGTSVVVNVVNCRGVASIALPAGNSYFATTTFVNENYTADITPGYFNVEKGINTINVTVDDGNEHDNATIHVDADIAGVYTVDINGTLYNVTAGVPKSIKLPTGEYYARVVGYSSQYYEAKIENTTFTVWETQCV